MVVFVVEFKVEVNKRVIIKCKVDYNEDKEDESVKFDVNGINDIKEEEDDEFFIKLVFKKCKIIIIFFKKIDDSMFFVVCIFFNIFKLVMKIGVYVFVVGGV